MGRYLIRRALFMVLVLFVVSVLTFLIFVKLPAGDPARRAVGRTRPPSRSRRHGRRSAWTSRSGCSTGRFAKGSHPVARPLPQRGGLLLVRQQRAGQGRDRRRLPVTVTLAVGAAILWLLIGIPIGIISAIRRRSLLRSGRDDRSRSFGVSMPIFWLGQLMIYIFYFKLGIAAADRAGDRLQRLGSRCARRASSSCRGSRSRHVGRVLRPDGARQHARDDERGLHPDGASQGHDRAAGHLQARAARRAHAGRHDARPRRRRSCSAGRSSRRQVFGLPGIGSYALQRSRRRTSRRSWA